MYNFYYVPYLYIIKTRLTAKGRLLSFFIILVFPPIYIATFLQSNLSLNNIILAVIGQLLIQNLYEIGYIQNDTETIKKESKPTIRLSQNYLEYYEINKRKIYTIRLITSIFLSLILIFISESKINVFYFLTASYCITLIFFLYNNIRNFINLILHLILNIIKYTAIQLLFLETASFKIFIISLFAYPVINLIDRATTPRFFPKLSNIYKLTEFRVIYYLILIIVMGIMFFNNYISFSEYALFIYYFLYRLAIKLGIDFKKNKLTK